MTGPGAAIFIGYRRRDSQGFAGRLADDLAERFGVRQVFRDDDIPEGEDFTAVLEAALAACHVFIVVIGPGWLDSADANGRRRLDDPDDWVRREIATALGRNVWVLPVLVVGTAMPSGDELPAEIAELSRVQAMEMSDREWESDLQRLITLLTGRVPSLARSSPVPHDSPAESASKHGLARRYRDIAAVIAASRAHSRDSTTEVSTGRRLAHLAWVGVKRLLLFGLVVLVAWYWLEQHASPGLRQSVADFIAFVRSKFSWILLQL